MTLPRYIVVPLDVIGETPPVVIHYLGQGDQNTAISVVFEIYAQTLAFAPHPNDRHDIIADRLGEYLAYYWESDRPLQNDVFDYCLLYLLSVYADLHRYLGFLDDQLWQHPDVDIHHLDWIPTPLAILFELSYYHTRTGEVYHALPHLKPE